MTGEKRIELFLKGLGFLLALGSALWAYFEFLDNKEKSYYEKLWNTKLQFYSQVTDAAAAMATTNSHVTFNKAREEYWKFFYGPLSLVEGSCVKQAMVNFSNCVPKTPLASGAAFPQTQMQQPSYRLATRLRDELAKGWRNPFSELSASRFSENECGFKKRKEC